MAKIDSGSKSSRLLASRRYTHDTLTTAQESFTNVLDLRTDEIYTQAAKIPSSGLPHSGSSQSGSYYTANSENILKYYYRHKLTKSNVNNETWFVLSPTGSNSGVGAQLINNNQEVNFVSPKYSLSSLATSTTEDSTPGYLATLFKSSAISHSLQTGSLDGDDIVSTNDYVFDYKTGIVQFMNSSSAPPDTHYLYMTINQYVGTTLSTGLELDGSVSGSSTSTGSFGSLDIAGNALFSEYIHHRGDTDTYIQFDADEINFVVGAANMIYLNEGGAGAQADKVTINNDLVDVDFQVKGDNEANLIRTDAANDRVGIGPQSPTEMLHISGSGTTKLFVEGDISGSSTSTGSFGRLEISGNTNIDGAISASGNIRSKRFEIKGADNYIDRAWDGSLFLVSAADVAVQPGGGELTVDGNVVPNSDSADDLGSTSKYWRNAYIDSVTTTGNVSGSSTSHLTMGQISSSGDVVADGDIIAYNSSDERLKDNIQVIKGSLDKIGEIRGVEFDWNEKSPGWARERGHDVGVIAQEVQKVIPEIVVERKNGFLGVDYKRLVPLLIESIKELKQEVEDLKKKVN
jgi:hypothetical protein